MSLNDLDLSFQIWQWLDLTGWRFLPYPGGLLDQPEWLMDDLLVIQNNYDVIARMLKVND